MQRSADRLPPLTVVVGLAALVALLAAGGLAWWSASGRGSEAHVAGPSEGGGDGASALPDPAHLDGAPWDAGAERVVEDVGATAPAVAPPVEAEADGRAPLTGVVLRDGRPAGGVGVRVIDGSGTSTVAVTGSDGAFTARVWPGALRFEHAAEASQDPWRAPCALSPEQVWFDAGSVELELTAPARALAVRVRERTGEPADGALVRLLAAEDGGQLAGGGGPRRAWTGDDGVAWFPLGEGDWLGDARVFAERVATGEVSEVRALAAPWTSALDAPPELWLARGAEVELLVRFPGGEPVRRTRVWRRLASEPGLSLTTAHRTHTDGEGRARFPGLLAGEHVFRVVDPRRTGSVEERVEVAAGAREELTVELPPQPTRLAVAGRVVDEEGVGIEGATVLVEDEPGGDRSAWYAVYAEADGAFRFWLAPRATVRISMETDPFADRFEPAELEVPFGTDDVLLCRVARVERRPVAFRVLDRGTGEPVAGAALWLFHPASLDELLLGRGDGLVVAELALREGTRFGVTAPGYLDASGELGDLDLTVPAPSHTVRLARGFARRLVVRDWTEGFPLADVRVLADGALVGLTGANGVLELEAKHAPAELTFEKEGYVSATRPAARRGGFASDAVSLISVEDAAGE